MSHKSKKIPKSLVFPSETKTPKVGILLTDSCHPEFKADQMDHGGSWQWNLDSGQLQEILQKIFSSQKLTWQELRNNGSHLVNRKDLSPEAQKRLDQMQKEDLDQLFSLRLTGRKRIWGIKEGNILWLLWWDPDHQVCPSVKKHT
jgi:hypothetical protein